MIAVGSRVISAARLRRRRAAAQRQRRRDDPRPRRSEPTPHRLIGIDETGDDPGEHLAHLALVAAHQHRVFQRVLRQRPQFGEVLVQHLDLLDAGNRLAFRRAPDREFVRCRYRP